MSFDDFQKLFIDLTPRFVETLHRAKLIVRFAHRTNAETYIFKRKRIIN